MDESSQIDVVTGTLALSSAKYAVIIGDEKQLPNVIPNDIAVKTNKIFNEYNLDKCYSYSLNSFLSSIKSAIPNIQNKMLVEHYRCHPKIINFCNKKFYNNQLAIMTKDNGEEDVIKVIKTVKGNTFNSERTDNTPCLAKQTYFIEKVPGTNDIVWEEISDIHRPFYITDDPKIISLFEALNALETAINNLNNN